MIFVNKPWHKTSIILEDPAIEIHRDCVYVPIGLPANFWENNTWGIYDREGQNISAAAHCFLPKMERSGQSDQCTVDFSNLEYAPDAQYFYAGNIMNHYGHFVCSSMSRLWALQHFDVEKLSFLGHAAGIPADWFSWSHTGPLFGAAGVFRTDFAAFDRPVRFRELIVARPSFVELNHAHLIHTKGPHKWGNRLVKTQNICDKIEIVYLSKSKFAVHPAGLSNEALIVDELSNAGVQIIYPEQLSIPEQIAVFRRAKIIIGQSGSAFHTSMFSTARADQVFITINHHPEFISNNHALLDAINLNRSYYVYFDLTAHEREGGSVGFRVDDPKAAARDLLAFANSVVL